MTFIPDYEQEINRETNYPVCNCGKVIRDYPPRMYLEFWLKEPDGVVMLYSLCDIDDKYPYDCIEDFIDSGTFVWDGKYFHTDPIFILAAMQGGE